MHILYTHTRKQADVTRAFLFSLLFFVLSDTTLRSHTHTHTHIPFPHSRSHSHFILLLFIVGQNAGYNSKNERNEMKRRQQHQKAKLNCPKRSLVSAFVICFVFVSIFFLFFWIRWTNFLLFALSLFLLCCCACKMFNHIILLLSVALMSVSFT